MRFPSTLLDFQSQFPDDDHCWVLGVPYAAPVGRVGSCARAAEAGEATFWQAGVSNSVVCAGIRVQSLQGPYSMGPAFRFECGS